MSRFVEEPSYSHGQMPRTGVLLVNLGTPDQADAPSLRRYLKEFLSDDRVVEVPKPLWWLILNGIILNVRPKQSAEKYATVWTDEGSPLRVHTERQAKLLRGWMVAAGQREIEVRHAMRYGSPSIADVLQQMKADGFTRILMVPMYPQGASSTTGSVVDEMARALLRWRNLPEMRYVRAFAGDRAYIDALASSVREHWQKNGRADKLVMSFHGVPHFHLEKGDPYHCECHKTGRLVAEALGLAKEDYLVTFQSRFGRARWLEPYTQPTLEKLAEGGLRSVEVMCPGFVADCLETLEEIAVENRDAFIGRGGKQFSYIPCLNERPDWIAALGGIVRRELGHWWDEAGRPPADLALQARNATAMGAKQ
ncbi:ferrochelatase [Methyloversatilis discipulorum]|uniref:ferrochelatase n=1 Tax=Methyloversatilis discipulorum TaxID=1119528 RepID=UPI003137FDD9